MRGRFRRMALSFAGVTLLAGVVSLVFVHYLGQEAETFFAAAPFPCPFHDDTLVTPWSRP